MIEIERNDLQRAIDAWADVVRERNRNEGRPPCAKDHDLDIRLLGAELSLLARAASPHCPKCGYTYEDCRFHMDHHLCGEPNPPSEPPVPAPRESTCHCETCDPIKPDLSNMRMILCAQCGNKRCPHATDHRNACTGSNEPGQPGSSYAAPPSEIARDAARIPREPTPEMIDAGAKADRETRNYAYTYSIAAQWIAMYDTALQREE